MKKTILNPLLALAGCFAAFNGTSTLQAQTTNIWDFNYTGSIVQWTVPSTGYYDVTAYGAQGGGFTAYADTQWPVSVPGGRGAVIGGLFLFEQGEVLSILAGGAGYWSSGGGGSFVVNSSTNPLVVTGGGGGTVPLGSYWPSASITTSGNNATYVNEDRQGSGGTNGTGGTVGSSSSPQVQVPKEVRAVGDSSVMGNLTTGQPPIGLLRTCILPAEPVISTVVLEEAEDTFTFTTKAGTM